MCIVSPSILSADFAHLSQEIDTVKSAPWLHIDVMDGCFVPNITIGIPVVKAIRKVTQQVLDVHLMIHEPIRYVERFAEAGADLICVHLEACADPKATIAKIRSCNKKVGVALKPATPVDKLLPYLSTIDMALVMTVEPGFGGQAFLPECVKKIEALKNAAKTHNPSLRIEVDGGINSETATLCKASGADILVAGSYVFKSADRSAVIKKLSA